MLLEVLKHKHTGQEATQHLPVDAECACLTSAVCPALGVSGPSSASQMTLVVPGPPGALMAGPYFLLCLALAASSLTTRDYERRAAGPEHAPALFCEPHWDLDIWELGHQSALVP